MNVSIFCLSIIAAQLLRKSSLVGDPSTQRDDQEFDVRGSSPVTRIEWSLPRFYLPLDPSDQLTIIALKLSGTAGQSQWGSEWFG